MAGLILSQEMACMRETVPWTVCAVVIHLPEGRGKVFSASSILVFSGLHLSSALVFVASSS